MKNKSAAHGSMDAAGLLAESGQSESVYEAHPNIRREKRDDKADLRLNGPLNAALLCIMYPCMDNALFFILLLGASNDTLYDIRDEEPLSNVPAA